MLTNEAIAVQSLFFIQNKDGVKVPFTLKPAQVFFDKEEHPRVIIAKARQKGFSSIVKAKFAIRVLGKEGTHAVIMSHESSATQRHMDQVQYLLKHMRGPKPIFGRNSRNELYFPKMESTYYIGTAGSKAFGRGDWITDLHCSEYAWWEDAARHQAGIFQAVPMSGRIILESTGNGRLNDFYHVWKHADKMGYKRLFYAWYFDDEYILNVSSWKPDTPKYNGYLLDLKAKHNLSDQQMAWYEWKFRELREDLRKMQQEYPSEPEECFQATGGAFFKAEEVYSPLWVTDRVLGYFMNYLKGHPQRNFNYVIGCDPSGGTGNDDMAIQIFCCQTGEQVLEFLSPNINPVECGRLLAQLGKMYNEAYIVLEGNNHGLSTIPILKELYGSQLIYKSRYGTATSPPKYGWINSQQAKHMLVGLIIEELESTVIYGKQTADELNSFEESETGKMEGESDNCVIAFGLAAMGLKKFAYLRNSHIVKPPSVKEKPNYMVYTLDGILENLDKRKTKGSWCKSQVGIGYS